MFRLLRSKYLRRTLRYNALRKGLLGRQPVWVVVLGLGLLGRAFGKISKRGPMPLVLSERLEPGQSMVIRHIPYEKKSRRRSS
jgi:hypothetical protein